MDVPTIEEQGNVLLKADEIDLTDSNSKLACLKVPANTQNGEDDEWAFQTPGEATEQTGIGSGTDNAQDGLEKYGVPSLTGDFTISTPQEPPPPLFVQQQASDQRRNPTDSLSLMQLKKLVTDVPKVEQTPYTFKYQDASSFGEEIEEWFEHNTEERAMLSQAQSCFAKIWQAFNDSSGLGDHTGVEEGLDWCSAKDELRTNFLQHLKNRIDNVQLRTETADLMCLAYIALGLWNETAGIIHESFSSYGKMSGVHPGIADIGPQYETSLFHIQAIRQSVYYLQNCVGLQSIFDATRLYCERGWNSDDDEFANSNQHLDLSKDDISCRRWSCLTILYMALEVARQDITLGNSTSLQKSFIRLKPSIPAYFTALVARLRWEDPLSLPLSKILLLYWKSILVVFGGLDQVKQIKADLALANPTTTKDDEAPTITASPLDYHLFRQEITSKYPAFDPPPPLFAFEPENTSILPPLPGFRGRSDRSLGYDQKIGSSGMDGSGTSILHQPVHIATPVPSPPPSPAGPGGKLGKKQNYQTNQMFPFLYPPLVPSSNDLGGKGSTEIQDVLVGRKWEGSDIPASILEAADLFAKRMRATRAMRQLWEERIRYLKYERGYNGISLKKNYNDSKEGTRENHQVDIDESSSMHDGLYSQLEAVEKFYDQVLPDLQSVVIVLLKVLLMTVTNLVTQGNSQDGLGAAFQSPDPSNSNETGPVEVDGVNSRGIKSSESILRDLDSMRSQEITGKALSAILLLLLKWFKVSHVLKFEYLSQLLLDSNYIQLTLKLFTHQELERAVAYRCERRGLSFFYFCRVQSRGEAASEFTGPTEIESDDAAPPPIKLRREDEPSIMDPMHPHGLSTDNLNQSGSLEFVWRNFFSTVNYLRILQKICKHKAHRNLLMVQYKYSNILKKSLKVPQQDIRLYTLKIIKGQVPYCNRKWRAANMRTITAIYLHCRPELRDDWLAGIDVDSEMMDALPQEHAIRALTYWYNIKRYPNKMGVEKGILEREQDFFLKELDALGSEPETSEADGEDDERRWEPIDGL